MLRVGLAGRPGDHRPVRHQPDRRRSPSATGRRASAAAPRAAHSHFRKRLLPRGRRGGARPAPPRPGRRRGRAPSRSGGSGRRLAARDGPPGPSSFRNAARSPLLSVSSEAMSGFSSVAVRLARRLQAGRRPEAIRCPGPSAAPRSARAPGRPRRRRWRPVAGRGWRCGRCGRRWPGPRRAGASPLGAGRAGGRARPGQGPGSPGARLALRGCPLLRPEPRGAGCSAGAGAGAGRPPAPRAIAPPTTASPSQVNAAIGAAARSDAGGGAGRGRGDLARAPGRHRAARPPAPAAPARAVPRPGWCARR